MFLCCVARPKASLAIVSGVLGVSYIRSHWTKVSNSSKLCYQLHKVMKLTITVMFTAQEIKINKINYCHVRYTKGEVKLKAITVIFTAPVYERSGGS